MSLAAGRLSADPLSDAASLEKSGQLDKAVAAYRAWLASAPANADWDKTFLHTVSIIQDPRDAAAMLADGAPNLAVPDDRHTALLLLARLDILTGNVVGAQSAFQDASLVPGPKDFSSLLSSATLLVQLGELSKAAAQAQMIVATGNDTSVVLGARVLLSRISVESGNGDRAQRELETLLADGTVSKLDPASLLEIESICDRAGNETLARRAAAVLTQQYPNSPERLVLDGAASRYPTPTLLLGFGGAPYADETPGALAITSTAGAQTNDNPGGASQATTATSATSTTDAPAGQASGVTQTSGTVQIQIGSYIDKANAGYRVDDLKNAGFAGAIVTSVLNGTTYYRVVVPNIPSAQSQTVLIELKDKGFEGFLLGG